MLEVDSCRRAGTGRQAARTPTIFSDWWLTSFGWALAALYAIYFAILLRGGAWLLGPGGLPVYTDFGSWWAAGTQALHGTLAALYDPARLVGAQAALFPAAHAFYPNWPYPPGFLLVAALLALLPYAVAFLAFEFATLAACLWVVWRIVGRPAAVALALAAPFTAWNFLAGQNGFLTAALFGGSLLLLERRPIWAGILIGCLTYKPQFGILFPLALVAAGNWRAIGSAAATAAVLALVSVAAFGIGPWLEFPHQLMAQAGANLFAGGGADWGYLQTVYGVIRRLHGGAALAWAAQGAVTAALGLLVWHLWRSRAEYAPKAAALSAAALIATPCAFAYDTAAIVVPAAFLAADQLRRGLLPGDKAFWIVLFGATLAVLVCLGDNAGGTTFGATPIGLFAALALLGAILRRIAALSAAAARRPALDLAEPGGAR